MKICHEHVLELWKSSKALTLFENLCPQQKSHLECLESNLSKSSKWKLGILLLKRNKISSTSVMTSADQKVFLASCPKGFNVHIERWWLIKLNAHYFKNATWFSASPTAHNITVSNLEFNNLHKVSQLWQNRHKFRYFPYNNIRNVVFGIICLSSTLNTFE